MNLCSLPTELIRYQDLNSAYSFPCPLHDRKHCPPPSLPDSSSWLCLPLGHQSCLGALRICMCWLLYLGCIFCLLESAEKSSIRRNMTSPPISCYSALSPLKGRDLILLVISVFVCPSLQCPQKCWVSKRWGVKAGIHPF